MSDPVDIAGLHKGAVLAALFNSSPPQGFGRMQGLTIGDPIDPEQGHELFRERGPRFGILGGRWIHVDLSGTSFDPTKYDEYLGEGAAAVAVRPIREAGAYAWEFTETYEDGMDGLPFARTEAPGALRNGTTVVKVNTGFDDDGTLDSKQEEHLEITGAFDGDRGAVLGSCLQVWGVNWVPTTPRIIYWVEWDHEPKVVYGLLERCLVPASTGQMAPS